MNLKLVWSTYIVDCRPAVLYNKPLSQKQNKEKVRASQGMAEWAQAHASKPDLV